MKKTLLLIMFVPILIYAQKGYKGIKFTEGISWEQVKAKAKAESKYIFIDAYATWCGPCMKMDKKGEKKYKNLYELANYAKSIREDMIAKQLAYDYIETVNKKQLFTEKKILFVLYVARNTKLADSLAKEYKERYLDKLNESEL